MHYLYIPKYLALLDELLVDFSQLGSNQAKNQAPPTRPPSETLTPNRTPTCVVDRRWGNGAARDLFVARGRVCTPVCE